jgi:hypothetical protein
MPDDLPPVRYLRTSENPRNAWSAKPRSRVRRAASKGKRIAVKDSIVVAGVLMMKT